MSRMIPIALSSHCGSEFVALDQHSAFVAIADSRQDALGILRVRENQFAGFSQDGLSGRVDMLDDQDSWHKASRVV